MTDPSNRLVIVESPAKARTIQKYLGPGHTVMASVGHIRDLPQRAADVPEKYKGSSWAKTGVNVEEGFAPLYVVSSGKKKTVSELRAALKEADELVLATDEDREGEAIAWHLLEVLKPKVPVERMVFNEITPEAIAAAAANTRQIDFDLVDAQETRRIVDRLYGYEVSPVLWRKVQSKLSAGRVQSVALRLVVQRERERIAFQSASYADVRGRFLPGEFPARLVSVDERRIAAGRDFDDAGQLTADVLVLDPSQAQALAEDLQQAAFAVTSVKEKPGTRRPAPPFITSTLQQEAGKRLRWAAQRTMRVAQGLYERGFITYMRTDSTNLSKQALDAARSQAAQLYGADHVADKPRTYQRKVQNAQEAHEAIRPAGDVFRTPQQVSGELTGDDFVLYDLIWKRTLASQMADAKVATTTVKLGATTGDGRVVEFSASGTVLVFPGFRAAYDETVDVEAKAKEGDAKSVRLPKLAVGDQVSASELAAESHATTPPARYTEASLVKALEERGIGRPSTYASIISTIVNRGYVWKKGSALVPAYLGMAVIKLLETHFADLVDYQFTAQVEEILDRIARGDETRLDALTRFYSGDDTIDFEGLRALVDRLGDIDARAISSFPLADSDIVVRVGRYGTYVQRGSDEKRASLGSDVAPDEVTAELANELIERGGEQYDLGRHPETGLVVLAKPGRYGPYVTEVLPEDAPKKAKPRTASLFKVMELATVTLDDAVRLLSLPRVVGVDPDNGEEVTAQNGRYGPYLKRGDETRSIETEEQIFDITLEQAQELFRQPKRRGRQAAPGRELGPDPTSGQTVTVKSGRFGHYVTDGEYNATLRTGDDPETVNLERAADLLAERRAKGPAKKAAKRTAKKTTKKSAKKTAKKTAKKATTKKAGAKKAAKKTVKKTAAKTPAAPTATGVEATATTETTAAKETTVATSIPPVPDSPAALVGEPTAEEAAWLEEVPD